MYRYVNFMMMKLFVIFSYSASAQTSNKVEVKPRKMKGTFYISWGYNREAYSRSDIRFKNTTTDNYDFTLVNAEAHDKPGFNNGIENFIESDLTIPQYNLHLGYLFKDKHNLGIEISWDHLKYVVFDN